MNETPRLVNVANGQVIEISSEKFSVGRSLKSDYVLDSVYISRIHFILERKEGSWVLQDNSSNGTLINGQRVNSGKSRNLVNGDFIKFLNAEEEFKFELCSVDQSGISDQELCEALDSVICTKDQAKAIERHVLNDHCYVEPIAGPPIPAPPIPGPPIPTSHAVAVEGNDILKCVSSTVIAGPSSNSDISNQRKRNSSPNQQHSTKDDNEESPLKKNKEDSEEKHSKEDTHENSTIIAGKKSQDNGKSAAEQNFDMVEQEMQCSICSELFIKAVTLSCCHTFCKYCIEEWKKKQGCCPICRTRIHSMASTLVLNNFIEKLIDQMDDETKQHRKQIIEYRLKVENEQKVSTASTSKKIPQSSSITISVATTSAAGTSETVVTISSDDEDDDDYSDDYSDQDDYIDQFDYDGVPGRYYGGYGRCYKCKRRGHWANGCPYR